MRGNGGLGALVRLPGIGRWLALLCCQRLPVAMAPLALLYLGREATGSLVSGAVLVGVYAFAESVCAAPAGRRFDRRPVRREFGMVLAVEAVFFLAAGLLAGSAPFAVLTVLVAVGGGVAAGAQGGLRSFAIRLAPGHVRPMLGFESAAGTSIWMLSPALVAGLAAVAGPLVPTFVMAGFAALGAVLARVQREPPPHPGTDRETGPYRWFRLVPSCAQAAAVNLTVGGLTVALVGLLPLLGTDGDAAGWWLTAFAGAGVLGGLAYGSWRLPGAPSVQATVLLAVLCVVVAVLGLVGDPVLAFVLILVVGVLEAPSNAARSLVVQQQVPQRSWSAAFSALYASAGVGYGAAGLLAAAVLAAAGPREAVVICAAVALLTVGLSVVLDRIIPRGGRVPVQRGTRSRRPAAG